MYVSGRGAQKCVQEGRGARRDRNELQEAEGSLILSDFGWAELINIPIVA